MDREKNNLVPIAPPPWRGMISWSLVKVRKTNHSDSLATKSSYKKDGKYISHTEWHRCVVFGKSQGWSGATRS